MREFILLALKAPTTSSFDIDNMPKYGRIDLVCRTISNTLYVSNHLRTDTIIHVCLNGTPAEQSPKIISFYGNSLRGLEPDERNVAMFLKKALDMGSKLKLNEEIDVQPGVKVSKKAFETLVREKAEKECKQIIYLDPKGVDLRKFKFKGDCVFLLGDYIGVPRNTEKLLQRMGAEKMKLGPVMVFASHCSILVHNELDRREFK